MVLFLLLFKKSTAQFTYCFISAILFAFCLIRTLFLCFHPEYLEKYHVIPKKKKTMEQLNAMLFVIQRQPYVIANYSKEMADIAESPRERANDPAVSDSDQGAAGLR